MVTSCIYGGIAQIPTPMYCGYSERGGHFNQIGYHVAGFLPQATILTHVNVHPFPPLPYSSSSSKKALTRALTPSSPPNSAILSSPKTLLAIMSTIAPKALA